jgi:ATP-dependent DNA helicase PIF1
MFHDICNNDRPFGGLTIMFGKKFHQIILVIVKGSRGQIVVASFQRSLLWDGICMLKLQQTMHFIETSLEN